jgi:hypothetical protein
LTEAKLNEDVWKDKETKFKKEKTSYEARINKLKRYKNRTCSFLYLWKYYLYYLRWLPTVLIVQHTIVLKNPLFYHLAKYDHETWPHNCYNIADSLVIF